jgi:hypothetical protein
LGKKLSGVKVRVVLLFIIGLTGCEVPQQCERYIDAANACIAVTNHSDEPAFNYEICSSGTLADEAVYGCMADVYEDADCTDLAGFIAIELSLQACDGASL